MYEMVGLMYEMKSAKYYFPILRLFVGREGKMSRRRQR